MPQSKFIINKIERISPPLSPIPKELQRAKTESKEYANYRTLKDSSVSAKSSQFRTLAS